MYFAWRKLANYRLSLGSIFEGGSVKEKEIRTCTWEYEVTKQYLALSASIFWYDFAQGVTCRSESIIGKVVDRSIVLNNCRLISLICR